MSIFKYDGASTFFPVTFLTVSLNLKGWKTKDAYSNNVNFEINNLETNKQVANDFFKIPKEEDL